MGTPGERVVFREPPVKAGKSGLKANLAVPERDADKCKPVLKSLR